MSNDTSNGNSTDQKIDEILRLMRNSSEVETSMQTVRYFAARYTINNRLLEFSLSSEWVGNWKPDTCKNVGFTLSYYSLPPRLGDFDNRDIPKCLSKANTQLNDLWEKESPARFSCKYIDGTFIFKVESSCISENAMSMILAIGAVCIGLEISPVLVFDDLFKHLPGDLKNALGRWKFIVDRHATNSVPG